MQKKVKTGFENITDKELVNFPSSDVRDGDRMVTESNLRLKKAINTFNTKTSKQTNELISLTGLIIVLTIVMLIGIAVQIGLLIYQIFNPQNLLQILLEFFKDKLYHFL